MKNIFKKKKKYGKKYLKIAMTICSGVRIFELFTQSFI